MTTFTIFIITAAILLPISAIAADITTSIHTQRYSHTHAENIPECDFALVLGTSKYVSDNHINRYYQYRIDAAVDLWNTGRIKAIIVSGSGLEEKPSETVCMQADLVAAGVPEKVIWQDPAGLRTLDSIIRFAEAYKSHSVCIVSQPFHNQRALVQARSYGLDAYAYHAEAVGVKNGWKVHMRERLARLRMWYDLILRRPPTHSISSIPITQRPTQPNACQPNEKPSNQ